MAATQCLGIDIGTHSIRIAELVIGGKGVKIKRLLEQKLELEAGQKESQRQDAIVKQLKAMLKDNKIKTLAAVFCVPGQTVFVRRVRVPKTSPERLERIIRFEARDQIPFPLDKTVLEYQVFETEVPTELEVLMVAIKKEYIHSFMKLVRKAGLKTLAISVSSLALHNFHTGNKTSADLAALLETVKSAKKSKKEDKSKAAEKGKKKGLSLSLGRFGKKKKDAEAQEDAESTAVGDDESAPFDTMELEEIQAYINLGASVMDLAIPKAGPNALTGFIRTVPVAGVQMDRAIKSKLGIDSIDEARKIKESDAVVLSSDFEISGDAESVNMDASAALTTVADRIVAEIRRSLDFFVAQPDGVAVDSLVLSGGLANLRHLNDYIEEKMGLPVELTEIKNEQIELEDDSSAKVSSFAIPIGLAIQGVGLAQISVDFLPQDIKNIRAFKDKQNQLIGVAALLVAMIGFSYQAGASYLSTNILLADELARLNQKGEQESKRVGAAEGDNEKLAGDFKNLAKAATSRIRPFEIYLGIVGAKPADVLFDRIEILSEGAVVIDGVTERRISISVFLENLDEHYIIRDAKMTELGELRFRDSLQKEVYPFSIRLYSVKREGRYRDLTSLPEGDVEGGTGIAALSFGDAEKLFMQRLTGGK